MGSKVQVDTITNVVNSSGLAKVNGNFSELADEFDKVLYKDGSVAVTGNIDMNGKRLINLPVPSTAGEPILQGQLAEAADVFVHEAILAVADATSTADESAEIAVDAAADAVAAVNSIGTAVTDAQAAAASAAATLEDIEDALATSPVIDPSLASFAAATAPLPILNGGTAATTASAARTALAALGTAGGTVTGNITRSGKGVHQYNDDPLCVSGRVIIMAEGAVPGGLLPGDEVWMY